MTIPTFLGSDALYRTQHDPQSLRAFALGAQHPNLNTLLQATPDALNTLAGQAQLEAAAQHYWQRVPCHSALKDAIKRHAAALLNSHNLTFEDITLHLAHPELPLLKYYGAIMNTTQDRGQLWRRHLIYCRSLSLALHEYSRSPDAQLCYSASSVVATTLQKKECVCFHYKAAAHCFHMGSWRYFLLPMPWE